LIAKWKEIREELKTVFAGRGSLFDSIIPPILFLIINSLWGWQAASWGSLASVILISFFRISKKQSLWFALVGLAVALIAVGLSVWIGRQVAYYLPSIINDLAFILIFLASLFWKRPMTAYTSYLIRAWPMSWYWQPKIRPAYMEVTIAWVFLFSLRLFIQTSFFLLGSASILAWLDFLMGWPFILVILIGSYLYGIWRLQSLGGPSVEEWQQRTPPPWKSQQRGF
jgi:hypothetical protein